MAKYYEIIGTDWVTDPTKGSERFRAWQREERKGMLALEIVRYQTIVLTFAKEKDVWKVASATWQ